MRKKPTITHKETIAKTRLFHVESLKLQFSNGATADYERLLSPPQGAVLIIPFISDDEVLLIREYGAGVERYELTLPKGRIEQDEPIIEAANREIKEEVGYGAHKLNHFKSVSLSPGYINHTTHLVIAQDLYEEQHQGDEPEPIEVVPWNIDRLWELSQQDDFTEARTIAALYMARDFLRERC